MNIALLSFHFAEYAYRLAQALAVSHRVVLLLDRDNAQAELGDSVAVERPGLRVVQVPRTLFYHPAYGRSLVTITQELSRFRPDVIHCQEVFRDYLTPVLMLFRNVPLVLTIHDHLPHSGFESRLPWRTRLHRWGVRRLTDSVVVHGHRIRKETEVLLPRLHGRVYEIPHGVLGPPQPEFRDECEQGTLLFFGRINRYKGLGHLLDAVDLLGKRKMPFRLVIAGAGPELAVWRQRIIDHPLIELREGFVPSEEVAALFRRSQVVVLPYTDGTQSGVAALGLNYGKAMIATTVGSLSEMVRHEHNGLLIPSADPGALADAMGRLIGDSALTRRMACASWQLGRGEFSWERIAVDTVRVYELARSFHGR